MRSETMILIVIFSSIFMAAAITGLGMAYYKIKIKDMGLVDGQEHRSFGQHYALITDSDDDYFWDSVYKGALEKGQKNDIYVEKFGKDLPLENSVNDLLKMAIAAKVDGIILQAAENSETIGLIDRAVEEGIPVVTVLDDAYTSGRQCFIGINNYSFGKKYGEQILEVADGGTHTAMVLLDAEGGEYSDNSQNTILSGIHKALEGSGIELQTFSIDRQSAFSSEEAIRDIMMGEANLPEVIVCLNTVDTICAYQAVVDLNKVGEVRIIGYYNSDTVLTAIKKKIIHSTIVINTEQMGAYCVEALRQYIETGSVSEYILINSKLISEEDVDNYIN